MELLSIIAGKRLNNKPSEVDSRRFASHYWTTTTFKTNEGMKNWLQVLVNNVEELEELMPFVRNRFHVNVRHEMAALSK